MLGAALGKAALVAFIYLVPAVSIALLLRGISDPRRERWDVVTDAEAMKHRYRAWAHIGLKVNHGLLAVFFVHLAAMVALATGGCEPNASHLTAAGANLGRVTDTVWTIGFVGLIALDLAGIAFGATYWARARSQQWGDPRRGDYLVVHLLLVPLALILLVVGFGVARRMVCG